MSKKNSELAYEIRKALWLKKYIQYDHENNKYIEWLIVDILEGVNND